MGPLMYVLLLSTLTAAYHALAAVSLQLRVAGSCHLSRGSGWSEGSAGHTSQVAHHWLSVATCAADGQGAARQLGDHAGQQRPVPAHILRPGALACIQVCGVRCICRSQQPGTRYSMLNPCLISRRYPSNLLCRTNARQVAAHLGPADTLPERRGRVHAYFCT